MRASTKLQALRESVKALAANENFIATFRSYRDALLAAQNIADKTQEVAFVREHSTHKLVRQYSVWLTRDRVQDICVRPSALSQRPVVDAAAIEAGLKDEERFKMQLLTDAHKALNSDTLEEAEAVLDSVIGERAKDLRTVLQSLRKEVSDTNREDSFQFATNDSLRHYAITKQMGNAERDSAWTQPPNISKERWSQLAYDGKVRLGSMKGAVKAAIERLTRTGKSATWSTKGRPSFCTIAKHSRRGDWWCLEDFHIDASDENWHVIEVIHYIPNTRSPENAFWREPMVNKSRATTWSVDITTFDGHLISRTVQASDGYNAERKIKAILSEAGMGGFRVYDVRQADPDSLSEIDIDTLEQETLDRYEMTYEMDYELLAQLEVDMAS